MNAVRRQTTAPHRALRKAAPAVRVMLGFALWWLTLSAAYLLLVSSPTGIEVPVGLLVGAAAAAAGMAGRRAFDPPATVPRFVRRAVLLPLDIAGDTVSLTRLLLTGRAFRADCGEVEELVLHDDDDATRAWAVLLTSAAPGSLATDVEDRGSHLVLRRHRLTPHTRAGDGWDTS
jgi:multisubunit Na+/H+ antiporter MnhE subunit